MSHHHDGSITAVGTQMDSYYGRPIVKEPVWQPEIPFYFFFGGLAGASGVLHAFAGLVGNKTLARNKRLVTLRSEVVSLGVALSKLTLEIGDGLLQIV